MGGGRRWRGGGRRWLGRGRLKIDWGQIAFTIVHQVESGSLPHQLSIDVQLIVPYSTEASIVELPPLQMDVKDRAVAR